MDEDDCVSLWSALFLQPGDTPSLVLDEFRPAWMRQAACRGVDRVVFFAHSGGEARTICARCPVRQDCLAYALADDSHQGFWAGTSHKERRTMRQHAA